MATVSIYRTAFQRTAVPLGLSLTAGLALASRQQPVRLDSLYQAGSVQPAATRGYSNEHKRRERRLNPEVIKQLSSGSLSGWFCSFPHALRILSCSHFHPLKNKRLRGRNPSQRLFQDPRPAPGDNHCPQPSMSFSCRPRVLTFLVYTQHH